MRLKNILISAAVIGGLFYLPGLASAEVIKAFNVKAQIRFNASVRITETIVYDFQGLDRHGIFRTIPVKYQARGGNYHLRLSEIAVADERGSPYQFTVRQTGANTEIKIGDPNVLVSGVMTYAISYTVDRALNYFSDHDEFYWNATGGEWEVPIESSTVTVSYPQAVPISQVQNLTTCFSGLFGGTQECYTRGFNGNPENDLVSSAYFTQINLPAGSGLTVVAGFPKGLVTKPKIWMAIKYTLADNWILGLPVAVFLVFVYLWHTRGRDPAHNLPIVAEYEAPENLSAAEAGTLVDEQAQNKDVSAAIVELAVKGYLKIRKGKREGWIFASDDWQLVRVKREDANLAPFEKEIMERIFSHEEAVVLASAKPLPDERAVSLFRLKDKFYRDQAKIKKSIYQALVLKGYFLRSPQNVRRNYFIAGCLVAFGGFWAGALLGYLAILAFFISGVLMMIFGFFMPKKTLKGAQLKARILGLKEYLKTAEADRLKFHNAPEKSPERFEKLLPYAMALNVEKEWARQFQNIYSRPPAWYEGGTPGSFNSLLLLSAMNDFSSTANANLSSAPGSSAAGGGSGFSGGFSGGGFGGGGGGSW